MPDHHPSLLSRRSLLAVGATAATAALVRAADPAGSSAPGQTSPPPADGPGIGVIGGRYQGSVIAGTALAHGRILALADVDAAVRDLSAIDGNVKKQTGLAPEAIYAAAGRHDDYRRLLDDPRISVLLIGAPDHWHAGMLIDAVKAGKHVYVEKPLTLTIDEGKVIRRVMAESDRVVQVGSWQRSDHLFRTAVEMVRAGRIGRLERIAVALGTNEAGGPFPATSPPPGLDWNRWLGQAPLVPYCPERCHYTFRWWLDYAGGKLTDHGAHHLDIAQWAIGADPVEVIPTARMPEVAGGYTVPVSFKVVYRYPGGVEMTVTDEGRNGILFEGSEGRIFVNRGVLSGKPVDELRDRPLPRDAFAVYGFDNLATPPRTGKTEAIKSQMANFFDCIAAAEAAGGRPPHQPISDVESQHRSATTCHLGNIACRLGRPLAWDAAAERFVGDAEADGLLARPQRKGFEVTA